MISRTDGAVAFTLTLGAGMCTCIGAAVVFSPALVKYTNNSFLAGSLSVAAGVMTYVSFIEIFQKSSAGFEEAGYSYGRAQLLATICFFAGILLGKGLNELSHKVSGHDHEFGEHEPLNLDELRARLEAEEAERALGGVADGRKDGEETDVEVAPVAPAEEGGGSELVQGGATVARGPKAAAASGAAAHPGPEHAKDPRLIKMGLQTALAIGIHNFPEGLATFVATLDDPRVGAGLAVAIAIHNIPEGLCVSVPIYYATHDRWEAFKWAFVSGISEPIGAALGWLALYQVMDDVAYGIVFGLVAGMMINICVKELLPTAFKYDPKDKFTTNCFILGMFGMSASLVLFLNV